MPKKFLIFDSDDLKKFHKRIFFSIIVFVSFYFIAIFRIADIMLIEKTVKETANLKEYIERGKIYDRNGQLLATNVKNYSLATNPLKINNKKMVINSIKAYIALQLFGENVFTMIMNQEDPFIQEALNECVALWLEKVTEEDYIYQLD